MNLEYLLKNIRFYVLLFSFSLSIYFYLSISSVTQLTQSYALSAAAFLYFTLLAGPFCYRFKNFPFRVKYIKARRALGVSTFYFGFLHACFAFFGELGGFPNLPNLPQKYLVAITLSFTSLVILSLMALTANDFMIEKLTFPRWKFLHRFIYLVGIFILIHALLIGSHFQNLSGIIPKIFFVAIVFLLFLELPRAIIFLNGKKPKA